MAGNCRGDAEAHTNQSQGSHDGGSCAGALAWLLRSPPIVVSIGRWWAGSVPADDVSAVVAALVLLRLSDTNGEFPNLVVSKLLLCNLLPQRRSSAPFMPLCALLRTVACSQVRS